MQIQVLKPRQPKYTDQHREYLLARSKGLLPVAGKKKVQRLVKKRPYTPIELRPTAEQLAKTRAEIGRHCAVAIRDAIVKYKPADSDELLTTAYRIQQCNLDKNLWLATDLHSKETGECYDGYGRSWQCGSKLCPHCVTTHSRHARRTLEKILRELRRKRTPAEIKSGKVPFMPLGRDLWFMTLTMPTSRIDVKHAHNIIEAAWSRLRKRAWFKRTIKGGCRSAEFTINHIGYHYHLHFILDAKYIATNDLRHYWTACLIEELKLAKKRGLEVQVSVRTPSGTADAQAERVTSMKDATNELAKYITKSDSWHRLDGDQLLNALRVARWPRMFEFFGSFRDTINFIRGETGDSRPDGVLVDEVVIEDEIDACNVNDETTLDKKELSDAKSPSGWRGTLKRLGVRKYLDVLHRQIDATTEFRLADLKRQYPYATFRRLSTDEPDNRAAELRLSIATSDERDAPWSLT